MRGTSKLSLASVLHMPSKRRVPAFLRSLGRVGLSVEAYTGWKTQFPRSHCPKGCTVVKLSFSRPTQPGSNYGTRGVPMEGSKQACPVIEL